jgi:hypothetical protein
MVGPLLRRSTALATRDTARAMSQENIVRGVRYPLSLPSGRAGQRRSLDEHLYVRFPALYRLLAARWMRLPPGSRLRRLVLRRLTARAAAAVNRRDFEVLFVGFDPGIEYHPQATSFHPEWSHFPTATRATRRSGGR